MSSGIIVGGLTVKFKGDLTGLKQDAKEAQSIIKSFDGKSVSGLTTAFSQATTSVTKLATATQTAATETKQLTTQVGPATAVVKALDTAITGTAQGISTGFRTSVSAVQQFGSAVATGFRTSVNWIQQASSSVKQFVGSGIQQIGSAFTQGKNAVVQFAQQSVTNIRAFISTIQTAGGVGPYALSQIRAGFQLVVTQAKAAGTAIASFGQMVRSGISSGLQAARASIVSFGQQIASTFQAGIRQVQAAGAAVVQFGAQVGAGMRTAVAQVQQAGTSVVQFGKNVGTSISGAVTSLRQLTIADVWSGIKSGTAQAGDAMKSLGSTVASTSSSIGSSLKSAFADLKNNGFPAFQQQVASAMSSAGASVMQFGSSLRTQAYSMAANLDAPIASALTKMKEGFSSALSSIPSLFSRAGSAASSFGQKLAASVQGAIGNVKKVNGSILDFLGKVGMAGMGVQALAGTAMGLGQALLGQNASMEQTAVGFETVLHSSAAARAEMQKLQAFAAATPFEFPELADADQKLLAFQFTSNQTIPLITAIGDALSGLGKNTPAYLDQVVNVFGQMKANGKLATQDLMQLTSVGINAFDILAKGMGKTVPQIKDMVSQGLIPADKGIELLRQGLEKTFGGGMQKQSMTFNGLLSTLQDNANAALRSFTGPIFEQAKGGLQQLGDLVSGPAFQKFATDMGTKVGQAIKDVANFVQTQLVPGFQNLVNIGGQVVKFFQDNNAALQILQTVGIAVAGAVIASLVVGFGAWAIAAGGAAIATLAATWPILAIGAAIGLLVAGFMTLYNNSAPFRAFIQGLGQLFQQLWTTITSNFLPVLQQVGAFLVSTFAPVWAQLVSVWQTQVLPAFQQLWAALQPIMPVFQLIGAIIVGVIIVAFIALIGILAGAAQGFAGLLSGLAVAIGGVVQIFSGIVQIVSGIIAVIYDLCTGNFSKLGSDLGVIWQGIVTMFTGVWNVISGVFMAAIGLVGGFVVGFVTTVVNLFMGLYNSLVGHSIIPDMVNGILQWIGSLPGKAIAFVTSLVTMALNLFNSWRMAAELSIQTMVTNIVNKLLDLKNQATQKASDIVTGIKNFFTGLPGQATKWMSDFGNNIVKGLQDMLARVRQAASDVAAAIAGPLAHSVPKMGPLAAEMTWMPHFGSNLTSGLLAQQGKVQDASMALAGSIAQPYQYPPAAVSRAATIAAAVSTGGSAAGGRGGNQTFIFEVDGYQFAQIVGNYQDEYVRLKFGPGARNS
jgi:tape measure domain-containing protein